MQYQSIPIHSFHCFVVFPQTFFLDWISAHTNSLILQQQTNSIERFLQRSKRIVFSEEMLTDYSKFYCTINEFVFILIIINAPLRCYLKHLILNKKLAYHQRNLVFVLNTKLITNRRAIKIDYIRMAMLVSCKAHKKKIMNKIFKCERFLLLLVLLALLNTNNFI